MKSRIAGGAAQILLLRDLWELETMFGFSDLTPHATDSHKPISGERNGGVLHSARSGTMESVHCSGILHLLAMF